MKYVVILGDGMADYPIAALDGKTPLEVANKPNIDSLAKAGLVGLCKTVPLGFKPGSDVANMSVMGYAPEKYYTGRSPIEALSIGIDLEDDDLAVRCNLVTLGNEAGYTNKTMIDYSAGEISSAEAQQLLCEIDERLGDEIINFYAGVSYRHCLVIKGGMIGTNCTPPHDITDKKITAFLPEGVSSALMLSLMQQSYDILSNHPINVARAAQNKNPANSIWLWGEGTKPLFPSFKTLYGKSGAVISAVDLVKGLGIGTDMKVMDVEGATGTIHTNFIGKADACIKALHEGADFVYLHIEAPDECGHQGDLAGKIRSIELIDEIVLPQILKGLEGEAYRILIMPDHPTPINTRTHCSDPVPFVLYDSTKARTSGVTYTETNAKNTLVYFDSGEKLITEFLKEGN